MVRTSHMPGSLDQFIFSRKGNIFHEFSVHELCV
jgi:hypothetical protein